MKIIFCILCAVALLISCDKNDLLPSDLVKWVESSDNGLIKNQQTADVSFTAIYKPTNYIVAIEERTNQLAKSKLDEAYKELDGLQYLELRIGFHKSTNNVLASNIDSQDEYFERLDYFVTHARYDMYLVDGQDTLLPLLYHFERNYGMSSENKILLAYNKSINKNDKQLIVNDQILGGGLLKFVFTSKDIESAPELKVY